jgi:hypothetical protein
VRAEKQAVIREKYKRLRPYWDERARRLWAGGEAISFGKGGIRAVAEVLRISQQVVIDGSRELRGETKAGAPTPAKLGRQRRPGGGRKAKAKTEEGLVKAIEEIVDPATRGILTGTKPTHWSVRNAMLRRLNCTRKLSPTGITGELSWNEESATGKWNSTQRL